MEASSAVCSRPREGSYETVIQNSFLVTFKEIFLEDIKVRIADESFGTQFKAFVVAGIDIAFFANHGIWSSLSSPEEQNFWKNFPQYQSEIKSDTERLSPLVPRIAIITTEH